MLTEVNKLLHVRVLIGNTSKTFVDALNVFKDVAGVGKPRLFDYNLFAFRLWRYDYRIENCQIWSVLSCGAIEIYAFLREIAGLNIFLDCPLALTPNFDIFHP